VCWLSISFNTLFFKKNLITKTITRIMKPKNLISALFAVVAMTVQAQSVMDINTKKLGAPIQPTMYGIFFEDINYAADGGLYGELVKNRSFEFPQHLMGWQAFGRVEVEDDGPFNRCPHYVVLSDPGHKERRTGLVNEGFFGIGVSKGESYRFSVWAKAPQGDATLRIQLIDESSMKEHQEFAEQTLTVKSSEWQKYSVSLTSPLTMKHAKLRIFLKGSNPVALEHVSLFPVNTYKNRENGMRRDLAQALADLHPGIFRFPGGCIVEGTDLATRYQWKNTIGPVENRPLNQNRWEHTFDYRYYPDTTSLTVWASSSSSSCARTSAASPCPSSAAVSPASSRTPTPRSLAFTCPLTS
jgi:hypothetical protein